MKPKHSLNKSQPELINEIVKDFIKMIDEWAEEDLRSKGYTTEQIYGIEPIEKE